MFREEFPWVYDLGTEAYRASLAGNKSDKAREAQQRFKMACRALLRGPFIDMANDKEAHMQMRELMRFAERIDFIEAEEAGD
jgi:hypothetical protein